MRNQILKLKKYEKFGTNQDVFENYWYKSVRKHVSEYQKILVIAHHTTVGLIKTSFTDSI